LFLSKQQIKSKDDSKDRVHHNARYRTEDIEGRSQNSADTLDDKVHHFLNRILDVHFFPDELIEVRRKIFGVFHQPFLSNLKICNHFLDDQRECIDQFRDHHPNNKCCRKENKNDGKKNTDRSAAFYDIFIRTLWKITFFQSFHRDV